MRAWLIVGLGTLGLGLRLAVLGAAPEPPETVTWETVVGEVVFPHRLHDEDLGLECVNCHHETTAARLAMPHPDYFDDFWIDCGICHGHGASPGSPRPCSQCHPSTPADVADETSSSKVVIHRSCWQCHEVTTGREASEGCLACHPAAAPSPGSVTPATPADDSGREGSR